MLQELTRKVRSWLQGREGSRADVSDGGTPEPGVPDAARRLCEIGAVLLREGKPAEALEALDAAVAACPEYADAHDRAGLALRELGRHEESVQRFQNAIDAQHDFVAAHAHQGIGLLELQRYEDAEDCFKLALAHDPGSADLWTHLAMACWNQRSNAEAIAHFRQALERDPGSADIHLFLAGLLHEQGHLEQAAEAYQSALALKPDVGALCVNYGLTLLKLKRADEAAAQLEKAVALAPDFAEAHFNLGNARRAQRRDPEAIACFERAIALKADYEDAWINLGGVFRERGAVDRALECYRRAHVLNPVSVEVNHNMGVACHNLGLPREAIGWYERAQSISSGHPESQLNLAVALLQTGDLARGWATFECRFRRPGPGTGAETRPFPYPRWEGQPLAGRSLLVWGEQGIGDEILFSSMYQEAIGMAQTCVIECAPKLVALFTRSFPGARVVPRAEPPHPDTAGQFDFQSPAGSLARWLRPNIEAFPARSGYLVADPERVAAWRERLARAGTGIKVGFCWRSSNLQGERALSCTRLDEWRPIFGVPGVQFVCLQYDECGEELARTRHQSGIELMTFPEVDLFNDLDAAAALTAALDLVVSAPTSVSLLSAALGVPTWQLTYGPDWQVHGTERNPWFPAMTQFGRAWSESWTQPIEVVARRLRERAAGMDGTPAAREPAGAGAGVEPARGEVKDALERGVACHNEGRFEEADAAYRRVLELDPGHVAARVNHALASYELGNIDTAVAGYEAVLRERPDHADARFNLGLALLARGDLARGWDGYEGRFDRATLEDGNRNFPFPRWEGEDLAAKTVLVWKEQSVACQILFAGTLPELVARAGYCIVECTPKLVPLFARSFPDCDVVPRTEPPHPYTQHGIDFQVPVCGLGRWLRQSLDAFPDRASHLVADAGRIEYWRNRLSRLGAGPKIGVSWRSIIVTGARALACTLIEQWRPILAVPGAVFVSLQYDECSEEIARARRELGAPIHELAGIDMFNDLDDVAALMRALDLVISAPTAVSVLAAALGVPTWQLHHGTDWQMHGQSRHPWLHSLRRVQRGCYQPWAEVMDEVAIDLERWLATRGSRSA